uniref:RNase H type-1 domain-containing protein n=1 Tax=Tanacetum cinerariifolium TaxID=118510 RepID=A0A699GI21_TANCI|nr:hypothetical protein [Tanacetum cinerariifolium]
MKLNLKKCSFGVKEGLFFGHLITKQGIRGNPSKVKVITDIEQPKTLKDIQSLNGKLAALCQILAKGTERSLPFFKVLKSYTDKKNIQWTQEAAASLQEIKKFVETLSTLTTPIHGEVIMMYLAASTESINAALFAKKGRACSCSLHYPAMEKLILALAIKLGEHDVVFQTRDDSNKEMPKDFLIEAHLEDNRKEVKRKTNTKLEDMKLSYEWKLYTDGASSSDCSGAGLMLIDPEAKQPTIREYLQRIKENLKRFKSYTIEHIRRNQNKKADALKKLASMTFDHLTKEVLVEALREGPWRKRRFCKLKPKKRKAG